jgi:hypothetical protein
MILGHRSMPFGGIRTLPFGRLARNAVQTS